VLEKKNLDLSFAKSQTMVDLSKVKQEHLDYIQKQNKDKNRVNRLKRKQFASLKQLIYHYHKPTRQEVALMSSFSLTPKI